MITNMTNLHERFKNKIYSVTPEKLTLNLKVILELRNEHPFQRYFFIFFDDAEFTFVILFNIDSKESIKFCLTLGKKNQILKKDLSYIGVQTDELVC